MRSSVRRLRVALLLLPILVLLSPVAGCRDPDLRESDDRQGTLREFLIRVEQETLGQSDLPRLWAALPPYPKGSASDALRQWLYRDLALQFDTNAWSLEQLLPSRVLASRRGSCLGTSLIALLAAEEHRLPWSPVFLPHHVFLRGGDSSSRVNFEPNREGWAYDDSTYRRKYGLDSTMALATATTDQLRASVLASVGNALLAQHPAAADPWYRRSLALHPTGEMAAGNLAIASARRGLRDSARVQALRLLQSHPSSAPARELLNQLAGPPRPEGSTP